MKISEKEFEVIPKQEISHIYKWGILTSINVDKDFLENHFKVIYFLNNFYLSFEYNKEFIYHKFEKLTSLREYIKLKWCIINSKPEALKQIMIDNEVNISIDDHWALKESFRVSNEDFVSLLCHPTRVDKMSTDQLTKYILQKWKTS
jgi:hypothetical protein